MGKSKASNKMKDIFKNEKSIMIEALEDTKKALLNGEINSMCYRLESLICLKGLTKDHYLQLRDILWDHKYKSDKRASLTTFWWPINVCRENRIKTINKVINLLKTDVSILIK